MVYRPLRYGGLGILAHTAINLRVLAVEDAYRPLRPWRGLDMHSSKVELDVFAASTFMLVGNGESNLFWEDRLMD
jgi:hypothetical protein